jgi:hypothetical protein
MLASLLFPPVPALIAVLVSGLLAFTAPKGKAAMVFCGCLLAFLGVGFLAIGKIIPRWGGGPPLEGSLATFGSLVMVVSGVCVVLIAFFKKSDDQIQRR